MEWAGAVHAEREYPTHRDETAMYGAPTSCGYGNDSYGMSIVPRSVVMEVIRRLRLLRRLRGRGWW